MTVDSDSVEDLEEYPDYYPVKRGQVFKDRYEIFHKLGYGTYSTVWLALDLQMKPERYVAVKIEKLAEMALEIDVMKTISQLPEGPGKSHIMTLLDSFDLAPTFGHIPHRVLVTEVMLSWSDADLTITEKKSFIKQILGGVEYLHKHGVTHNDLHPKNFMLRLGRISGTLDHIKAVLGPPVTIPVDNKQRPFLPDELVYPCRNLSKLFNREEALHAQIIDLGTAYIEGADRPDEYVLPDSNYPPEVMLGLSDGFQPACDVWSLGCSIYEIMFGYVLLDVFDLGLRDRRFIELVKLTGRLPESWKIPDVLKEFKDFQDQLTQKDVEERWKEIGVEYTETIGTGTEDAALFVDLLKGILQARPEDRMGLAELQEHPWFSNVSVCKTGIVQNITDSKNNADGA